MGNGKLLGVDQFAEFAAAVVRSLPRDISSEMAQHWIQDQKDLEKFLGACLYPAWQLKAATPAKSLGELIPSGNFGYVNQNITEANFPDIGVSMEDSKIYDFKKVVSSEYATDQMDKDDHRPANLRELLIWMLANWNGKDLVVALGQSWRAPDGYRYVPCLSDWSGGRSLGLYCLEGVWDADCRFLAFRKSSRR